MKPIHLQHINAALEHHRAGRLAQAEPIYRRVLADDPRNFDALYLLAVLIQQYGDNASALPLLERAVALAPNVAHFRHRLGDALIESSQLTEAEAQLRRAIELQPRFTAAHDGLGGALLAQGRADEAIASFRRAVELDPKHHHVHSNLLVAMHYTDAQTPDQIFQAHLRWAKQRAAAFAPQSPPVPKDRDPDRRLRIGYVSPNFTFHSIGFFIDPLLSSHDRERFEIFCFSDVPTPTPMTARLKGFADHWHDIAGAADERVAEIIRDDQIDILIDLAGHTAHNRMTLFARKPAPIQATYLGYPDTTGLASVDYRITDALADPVGATERFHTERLLRLPGGAWCYRPVDGIPDVAPAPFLVNGHITFGSFNNLAKITPRMIELWAALLRATPRSRLLIKARNLQDTGVQRRLIEAFRAHGIEENRLDLHPPAATLAEHLAIYSKIDIALDTYPYHGTTTTCEALWMGVPVVTLAGPTHVSRVGVSLLTNVGLQQFIANSSQQYVEIAAEIAADAGKIAALKGQLRERMRASPLLDAPAFTRNFERALRQMWEDCISAPAEA